MSPNLNQQAIDLCEIFLKEVKRMKKNEQGKYPGTPSYKRTLANNALELLNAGVAFVDICQLMEEATGSEKELGCYNIAEYITMKRKDFVMPNVQLFKRSKDECVQIGKFYYHPELQTTSKPARYLYDPLTFEMSKIEPEPFFLEMRMSFTVQDTVAYFIRTTEADEIRPERFFTQTRNLIQDFGLDLTLYLIDAGVDSYFEENHRMPGSPAFLIDYLDAAKNMLGLRINTLKEAKLDHVIPRRTTTTTIEPR